MAHNRKFHEDMVGYVLNYKRVPKMISGPLLIAPTRMEEGFWIRDHACNFTRPNEVVSWSTPHITPRDDVDTYPYCSPNLNFNPFKSVLLGDFDLCFPSQKITT